jgi:Pyridine nucleotide-disulphide oxidoreductase, dimerisation domain
MLVKLVVDGTTDRTVGCHIVEDGAAEMVQVLGIMMKMKATKADFDATMALHPTAAEERDHADAECAACSRGRSRGLLNDMFGRRDASKAYCAETRDRSAAGSQW